MTYFIEERTLDEQCTAVLYATVTPSEIPPFLATAFPATAAYLASHGVGPIGRPYARYHANPDGSFEAEAGFVASTPVPGEGDVEPSDLPGGRAAVTTHVGPYDTIGEAHAALDAWVREHDGETAGDPWEVYATDPDDDPDPAHWRTVVVQPFRSRDRTS